SSASSSNSTISFSLTNGTYTFSVSTVDKEYYPSPSSFTLRINGQSSSELITFTLFTSVVSFSESGLPINSKWFVNLSGPIGRNLSTTSSLISFNAPNGTYIYSVSGVNKNFGLLHPTGNFTVTGNPVSVGVAFLRLYTVTFYEQGLPGGVEWYVNITDPSTFNSSSSNLSFLEPNGSYFYIISVGNKSFEPNESTSIGNFTVSGSSVTPAPPTSPVIFYALHKITFTESRLPSSVMWYLNVTYLNLTPVNSLSSYQNSISFLERNGTYRYQISTSDDLYRASPFNGKFTVKGWPLNASTLNIPVTFYLVTYSVSFTETGLTNGTPWSVTLNNTTRQSLNNTVVFSESNGSYAYIIQGLSGFVTTLYSGNLTVNGTNVNNVVAWKEVTYQMEIIQTGISSGTHWSVTIQGKTFDGVEIKLVLNSTGSSVVFSVPNGTYNYTITPPLGYSGTHLSGIISIQGNSATASAFLRAPNYILIAMVLALVIAGLVTALYIMIRRDNRSMFRRDSAHNTKDSFFFTKKKE
ncbi:MAG: hypothetical protein M1556_04070, partial [Candidatus Thermoplasmatota archaeon]|nr:hypothetical protein [Candidatus Thermoplasmatota archaeon]